MGRGYAHFFIEQNELETYPTGTIRVLPKQGAPIVLLYDVSAINPCFVEKQCEMHDRYKWLITPLVHKMEDIYEPLQKDPFLLRILHSLHMPKVVKNLKLLKSHREAIDLVGSLKTATEQGIKRLKDLDSLLSKVHEIDELHDRMVSARKAIYELEKTNYNAIYF
jgi:hypothetical protein